MREQLQEIRRRRIERDDQRLRSGAATPSFSGAISPLVIASEFMIGNRMLAYPAAVAGVMIRWKAKTKSSEVTGSPFDHLALSRR